jgi:hypothetical protein
MERGWEPRPFSQQPRERRKRPSTADGSRSTNSSFASIAPGSFSPISPLAQRRRSSAIHAPPAAPPPTNPIPRVPEAESSYPISNSTDNGAYYHQHPPTNGSRLVSTPYEWSGNHSIPAPQPPPTQPLPNVPGGEYPIFIPIDNDQYRHHPPPTNGSRLFSTPYERLGGSPNLAAVAAYPEIRHAASHANGTESPELFSDPPPRSMTYTSTHLQTVMPAESHTQDPILLSPPPESRATTTRPSSRRALTRALELAREAVMLDSANDDPYAAVVAYGQSVALLSEVMERVRRGEDSTESSSRRRNGRRRSARAQEEEIKRLKKIVRA